jgi:hypothetical protein
MNWVCGQPFVQSVGSEDVGEEKSATGVVDEAAG